MWVNMSAFSNSILLIGSLSNAMWTWCSPVTWQSYSGQRLLHPSWLLLITSQELWTCAFSSRLTLNTARNYSKTNNDCAYIDGYLGTLTVWNDNFGHGGKNAWIVQECTFVDVNEYLTTLKENCGFWARVGTLTDGRRHSLMVTSPGELFCQCRDIWVMPSGWTYIRCNPWCNRKYKHAKRYLTGNRMVDSIRAFVDTMILHDFMDTS